jgi:hypothetical protein
MIRWLVEPLHSKLDKVGGMDGRRAVDINIIASPSASPMVAVMMVVGTSKHTPPPPIPLLNSNCTDTGAQIHACAHPYILPHPPHNPIPHVRSSQVTTTQSPHNKRARRGRGNRQNPTNRIPTNERLNLSISQFQHFFGTIDEAAMVTSVSLQGEGWKWGRAGL